MPEKTMHEQYDELMKHNGEGKYLYTPQRYKNFHPGSVGFFDLNGGWNEIADLSNPESLKEGGFSSLSRALTLIDPVTFKMDTRTSESENETNIRGNAEASGAMAAAPVEASGEGKYKTSSKGKAALIADGLVKHEKYKAPFDGPIKNWIKENGNKLAKGDFAPDIAKYGLWAVQATWSTQECAITMSTGKSHDIDLGLKLGATGIGKLGGGGGSLAKLQSEGWSTYKANEGDKGMVVSFSGVYYKLRTFSKMFSSDILKAVTQRAGGEVMQQAIVDENGNVTGYEEVRPIRNEKGQIVDYQKVEDEEAKEPGNVDFDIDADFNIDADYDGRTEEDIQAEKEFEEEQRQKLEARKQEILQIPDEEKRRAELIKFMTENVTTEEQVKVL